MTRVRATALVLREDKILLIHRHNNGEEYWVLPGGGVEEGELIETAVVRELAEETSIRAELSKKVLEFTDSRGDIHHVFACSYLSGEPKLQLDSVEALNTSSMQSYEPVWMDINQIPYTTIYPREEKDFLKDYIGAETLKNLENEGYSPVYVWNAEAGEIDEEHIHDFDTKLVILDGEIHLKIASEKLADYKLKKEDCIEIPRNKLHSAVVGSEGCRYIVAERHKSAS